MYCDTYSTARVLPIHTSNKHNNTSRREKPDKVKGHRRDLD